MNRNQNLPKNDAPRALTLDEILAVSGAGGGGLGGGGGKKDTLQGDIIGFIKHPKKSLKHAVNDFINFF